MVSVREHKPDCRVFVKRLITQNPEVTITPEEVTSNISTALEKAFGYYLPKDFRPTLYAKYKENNSLDAINKEKTDKTQQNENLKKIIDELNAIKSKDSFEDEALYEAERQVFQNNWDIINLNRSIGTIKPIYEPHFLEILIGVQSVTTTILRTGIGNATITLKLPLEENGFTENLLYAVLDTEMIDLDKNRIDIASSVADTKGTYLSSRQLNIFKTIINKDNEPIGIDKRQCELQPMDMIQVWFSKRYINNSTKPALTTNFPQDYAPGFTGFVKGTNINYSGGQNPGIIITITVEDVGKPLRQSRANIDPALDPRFRMEGLDVTAFQNKLQVAGEEQRTGEEHIRDMIQGRPGVWWGASQVEVLDDMAYDQQLEQYARVTTKEVTEKNNLTQKNSVKRIKAVNRPWEFDKIPLNAYSDLINKYFLPYVATFKSAFKLWESEYKYRWDICKEIAEVMEFEFYADNYGVINYHPPLYNWNPANLQYFIEDKEIISESNSVSDANIVTNVEIVSQSTFGIPENVVKNLSSFASANDALIQRYGVRFRSKTLPFLSGTEKGSQVGSANEAVRAGRYLYARAWLNRRNYEIKSAEITIPGTPEYSVCNVVALVGNLDDFSNQVSPKITDVVTSEKNRKIAKDVIDNINVYYINGITHKYMQGASFTTTLSLTHGRKWGKRYGVGYGFTPEDDKEIYEKVKKIYFKQEEDDVENARKVVVNGKKAPTGGQTATKSQVSGSLEGIQFSKTKYVSNAKTLGDGEAFVRG